MIRDRVTLTETERDDLCDAMVDYTSNRASAAPARLDRYVVPAGERIIDARVAEITARVEALADRWDEDGEPWDPGRAEAAAIRAALRGGAA